MATVMVLIPASGIASGIVYTPGTHHCSPHWRESCIYYITSLTLGYGVTVPAMTTSYVLITMKVKKSTDRVRRLRKHDSNSPAVRETKSSTVQQSVDEQTIEDCTTSFGVNVNRAYDVGNDVDGDKVYKMNSIDDLAMSSHSGVTWSTCTHINVKKNIPHRYYERQIALAGKRCHTFV